MLMRTDDMVIDVDVTTVTLSHDITDPQGNRIYMFHCSQCGSPVVQYCGFIARIFPGWEPFALPIILRCTNKRCPRKYLFHSIV